MVAGIFWSMTYRPLEIKLVDGALQVSLADLGEGLCPVVDIAAAGMMMMMMIQPFVKTLESKGFKKQCSFKIARILICPTYYF